MSRIALNHSSYTSLLQLRQVSCDLARTQNILSTGNKVNSALDNPSSYYTARALNNRATDLSALLDNMGQKIQTIKAAGEGVSAATTCLEQMTSVAEQALSEPQQHRSDDDLIKSGYTLITSSMTATQINALIEDGTKLALSSDITLDNTINITASDVVFDGNGYTINFAGSGKNGDVSGAGTKAAIEVKGETATADFKNIKMELTGDWAVGISSRNGANVTIDNTYGINTTGENSYRISHRDELLYAGSYNTKAIVNQIHGDGLAATACDEFYVVSEDEDWYLPSFGELLDVYGYDKSVIPAGTSEEERKVGAIGDNKKTINDTLGALKTAGVAADKLTDSWYWSSSEGYSSSSWKLYMLNGFRDFYYKYNAYYVRSFQLLKNCFNPLPLSDGGSGAGGSGSAAAPKIGDVMYADKTWSSVENYDSTKTVIGVVVGVSDDQRDVTIMNLKNLRFTTRDTAGNFKPETPYTGAEGVTRWATTAADTTNITTIKNYTYALSSTSFQSEGTITVTNELNNVYVSGDYSRQFNTLHSEYDNIINDSSYKGVNLLKGESMEVKFNDSGTSKLTVQGENISSDSIGLEEASWATIQDVAQSIKEIKSAINTLRSVASSLGNNNSIIQTRQDFTQDLINILEEGADKLTLADMNEASADMLALQTRQQLAINALSLATQAEQGVLRLF